MYNIYYNSKEVDALTSHIQSIAYSTAW